jgi:hypothetical protein
MDTTLIIVLVSVCSIMSSISGVLGVSGYYYKYYNTVGKWNCTLTNTGNYIVSRINNGESECISEKDGVGCYSITGTGQSYVERKKSAEDICKNIIQNYPNVTLNNKNINMEVYTCGKNSTNQRLWGNTGYESKNDTCSQILTKNKLSLQELMKF